MSIARTKPDRSDPLRTGTGSRRVVSSAGKRKRCLVFRHAAQQLGKRSSFHRYQTVFNGENWPIHCLISRQRSWQPLLTPRQSLCDKGDRTSTITGPVPFVAQALRDEPDALRHLVPGRVPVLGPSPCETEFPGRAFQNRVWERGQLPTTHYSPPHTRRGRESCRTRSASLS